MLFDLVDKATTPNKKLLILGGSSWVGRHLFGLMGPERAIATYASNPIEGGIAFNVLTDNIEGVLPRGQTITDAVVLLGDTEPDSCVADRAKSYALNVEATRRVLDDLYRLGIHPIFTSTEFVFDGVEGNYSENDPANPVLLYGAQKYEIEEYLRTAHPDHTILRLAKVYGDRLEDGSLFSSWVRQLDDLKQMSCATDQKFSPVHVQDVCQAILLAVSQHLVGTFHVCGPIGASRLDFLAMVLEAREAAGMTNPEVLPVSIHDFNLPEKRPLDVRLNSTKLEKQAGYKPQSPHETINKLLDQKRSGERGAKDEI